jgi:membrane protease YdiL (CAAX protease family)
LANVAATFVNEGARVNQQVVADARPRWRQIVAFPLVSLVIAMLMLTAAIFLAEAIMGLLIGITGQVTKAPTEDQLMTLLTGRSLIPSTVLEIVFSVLAYKLVIRRLGEWPRDDFRLDGAARDSIHGLLAGLLIFSLIVGVAALLGVYHIIRGGSWASFFTILFSMAIGPGFREELMFRGVLFRFTEEFGGSWFALILTSALFGLSHINNHDATWVSSLFIAVEAGMLLGALYMLTRNLWMCMGFHAAWNFTQGFIWDVPVSGFDVHGLVTARLDGPVLLSGGPFGLEASLIAFVCATALGLFYLKKAVDRGHLESPWWVRRRRSQEAVGVDIDADPDAAAPVVSG